MMPMIEKDGNDPPTPSLRFPRAGMTEASGNDARPLSGFRLSPE